MSCPNDRVGVGGNPFRVQLRSPNAEVRAQSRSASQSSPTTLAEEVEETLHVVRGLVVDGDRDGCVIVVGGNVRQLRRRSGCRKVYADRRPRPRLPAADRLGTFGKAANAACAAIPGFCFIKYQLTVAIPKRGPLHARLDVGVCEEHIHLFDWIAK